MLCTKIRQLLNAAILKGEQSIKVTTLSENDKEDLRECGYTVKEVKGEYIISH